MASNTGDVRASRLPVISAEAIDPASPFTAARMRLSIPSRIASTLAAKRNRRSGATGGCKVVIAPSASPVAPICLK